MTNENETPNETNPLEAFINSMNDPGPAPEKPADMPDEVWAIIQGFKARQALAQWVDERVRMLFDRARAMMGADVNKFLGQDIYVPYMAAAAELSPLVDVATGGDEEATANATALGAAWSFWCGYMARCREESTGTPAFVPEAGYIDPFADGTAARDDEPMTARRDELKVILDGFNSAMSSGIVKVIGFERPDDDDEADD